MHHPRVLLTFVMLSIPALVAASPTTELYEDAATAIVFGGVAKRFCDKPVLKTESDTAVKRIFEMHGINQERFLRDNPDWSKSFEPIFERIYQEVVVENAVKRWKEAGIGNDKQALCIEATKAHRAQMKAVDDRHVAWTNEKIGRYIGNSKQASNDQGSLLGDYKGAGEKPSFSMTCSSDDGSSEIWNIVGKEIVQGDPIATLKVTYPIQEQQGDVFATRVEGVMGLHGGVIILDFEQGLYTFKSDGGNMFSSRQRCSMH